MSVVAVIAVVAAGPATCGAAGVTNGLELIAAPVCGEQAPGNVRNPHGLAREWPSMWQSPGGSDCPGTRRSSSSTGWHMEEATDEPGGESGGS